MAGFVKSATGAGQARGCDRKRREDSQAKSGNRRISSRNTIAKYRGSAVVKRLFDSNFTQVSHAIQICIGLTGIYHRDAVIGEIGYAIAVAVADQLNIVEVNSCSYPRGISSSGPTADFRE